MKGDHLRKGNLLIDSFAQKEVNMIYFKIIIICHVH